MKRFKTSCYTNPHQSRRHQQSLNLIRVQSYEQICCQPNKKQYICKAPQLLANVIALLHDTPVWNKVMKL